MGKKLTQMYLIENGVKIADLIFRKIFFGKAHWKISIQFITFLKLGGKAETWNEKKAMKRRWVSTRCALGTGNEAWDQSWGGGRTPGISWDSSKGKISREKAAFHYMEMVKVFAFFGLSSSWGRIKEEKLSLRILTTS